MYNFNKIEKKWQKYWEDNECFKAEDNFSIDKKFYGLIEFPYPSGIGLHLGHIKPYISMEVISRKRRMEGYNVLFPIGFDSFGLPAENYAIKIGKHPRLVTEENIEFFTNQLKRVGYSFDWSRVIKTSDPEYYKWTQWIFLKLFEKGLAYKAKTYINFCPSCNVVLSNEESQNGKCDRCGSDVIQKEKDVWFLKITEYAERLLDGLNKVNYLPKIKAQQENWIGKSEGAYVNFKIKDSDYKLRIYTTRPDTLFGATFMVIAPEHPLINKFKDKINNMDEVIDYREKTIKKSEFERVELAKDKTGVKLDGISAINPVNNKEIPIYISDYVMMSYGTGAIMAVPAHDDRDFEFAKKFNIPIIQVITFNSNEEELKEAYTGDGIMINSEFLNGINNKKEAVAKMISYLEEKEIGEKGIQYKMKDWPFNRQRYWGEPIPIVYCDKCGIVPVPYEELPLKLPEVDKIKPGKNGESPLANIPEFVNCKCPICGGNAKRETDTMPQWAGSSWYFLRYIDPHNDNEIASMDKLKYWAPVDWYNGGMEHVTRHLLYSRFWHMFLYDIGIVPTEEPYLKRTAQGLVLGKDGQKMSKSKGNAINPIDIINEYGADTIRTYMLFIGEYGEESIWNDQGVKGVVRFLDKVYELKDKVIQDDNYTKELESLINQTIKKVSEDIENMKFNTAISSLMILANKYFKQDTITKLDYMILVKMLYPFAPHLCEELNELIGNNQSLVKASWPKYNERKIGEDSFELIMQVNGKIRGKQEVSVNINKEEMKEITLNNENVKKFIGENEIVKIIVVPKKLVNVVIKN